MVIHASSFPPKILNKLTKGSNYFSRIDTE